MNKHQVSSFTEFGPYRSFSNGDLETYNGLYDGEKENVQFFFDVSGLRRIGVYLYEGNDIDRATEAWKRAYASLNKHYGPLETPGYGDASKGPLDINLLALSAQAKLRRAGKIQMAPVHQPDNVTVFSSFMYNSQFQIYDVTINFDPEGAKVPDTACRVE